MNENYSPSYALLGHDDLRDERLSFAGMDDMGREVVRGPSGTKQTRFFRPSQVRPTRPDLARIDPTHQSR